MSAAEPGLTAYDSIQHWARTMKPDCAFEGEGRKDYMAWRRRFQPRYRGCIGPWPAPVPLRLRLRDVADQGDHVRKRVLYDSCAGVTVPAYLLEPKGLGRGEKRPALLAAHGHGAGACDIAGVTRENGSDAAKAKVARLNYEYALEAVRWGYVVIAPDWCPFGERTPPVEWTRASRDACNMTDLAWQYFGRSLLNQNIWDGMRAVDVLWNHPNVDRRRTGVIGLSFGGTMATHMLINDPRLRAGVVSGYISTIRSDALNMRGKGNTCGAQHVPGILRHGDIADMLGLAVPKPVLFEMGRNESCFHYPDMRRAYAHLKRIYEAAGRPECIDHDTHPNGHMWSGKKAWAWLEKWLG